MAKQQKEQPANPPLSTKKKGRKLSQRKLIIIAVIFIALFITIIWILSSLGIIPSSWAAISSSLVAVFGMLFTFLQSLHLFLPPNKHEPSVIHGNMLQPASSESFVQLSTTQTHVPYLLSSSSTSHRGIVGLPPSSDPKTIQQRELVVKDIYVRLIHREITAIALTGIGGVGKSTLAALIYHYVERQRQLDVSLFQAETLWFTIDPIVTFADLAGNLFEAFGKPLPDLNNLAPQNQALALYNVLNTTDKPRLIILGQFENLLNWDDGHTLPDRPGVGEWLDILNGQPLASRILLTSRPRPIGTREYIPIYLQEYPVVGLEKNEGIALLRNQGVVGTDIELRTAVLRCAGHAFSLTLLASLTRDHRINLTMLLKSSVLWTGDIATNLLDQIYSQRLSEVQRHLLLAFSVYREPVPLEAAKEVISNVSLSHISTALKALLIQHMLEAVGEGRYQLHAIIADYIQNRFEQEVEQATEGSLQSVHLKAAKYYLQQAAYICPLREQRRKVSDVHELIEALWQYCQAGRWREAYELVEHEGILEDLSRWGGNAIIYELCHLLLSADMWRPNFKQEASVYGSLASASSVLGQREYALQYYERALSIYRNLASREGEITILIYLGNEYTESGQYILAQKYYEQALSIGKEFGNRSGEAMALNGLGWTYRNLRKTNPALKYYKKALHVRREIGDRKGESGTLNGLGLVYSDLKQYEEALKHLEQSLNIRREFGDRRGEAGTLNNLGLIFIALGERERAAASFEQSLRIRREIGDRLGEGKVTLNIGKFYFEQNNFSIALAFFLVAKSILHLMKVPDRDYAQKLIDLLSITVGEYDFATLVGTVELQAHQIVDQVLQEGIRNERSE